MITTQKRTSLVPFSLLSLTIGLIVLSTGSPASAQPVDPECASMPTGGQLPERQVDVKGACSMPCVFGCGFSGSDHNTMECKDRRGNNMGRGVASTGCPPLFQKVKRGDVFVCVKPGSTCPDTRPPFSITDARVRDSATQTQARSEVLYRPVATLLKPGMCAQGGSDGRNLVFFHGSGLERATSASTGEVLDPLAEDVRAESCALGCRALLVRVPAEGPSSVSITLNSPDGRSATRTFAVQDGLPPRVEKCAPAGPRIISCPAGQICR